ncbi:MAG: patatin-like phospholipase family protein, partial [Caldisericia bacterium]|nr:patatin-like phospholipase family protein [Caldisericia bacterium]
VVGTSIGAMNAAMIAQGNMEKAYELWQNISTEKLFGIPHQSWGKIIDDGIQLKEVSEILKTVKGVIQKKGLDRSKVKLLLEDVLDEEAIRESPMDFGLVTYSLTDLKSLEYMKEDIPEGKIIEYILASANLPIFQAEKTDGKILLDGGVYDNLPVQLLTKKGYKDLVLIRTFAIGRVKKFNQDQVNALVIEPGEDLGNIMDFRPEKGQYLLNLGYYDVKRKFQNLKGEKYYIQPKNDEKFFVQYLIGFSDQGLEKLANILELGDVPDLRFTFEHVMPLIADALDLPRHATYEEILLGVAEWMAGKLALERFKIYTVKDLFHAIQVQSIEKKAFTKPKKLPALLVKNELGAKLFKENILQEVSWFIAKTRNKE